MKRKLDIGKKRLIGYAAGILAGVSYGTNPLFGKALMESGVTARNRPPGPAGALFCRQQPHAVLFL